MLKIVCVCGTRPNFVKVAPLIDAFRRSGAIETVLVHTGQHYDDRLSRRFFEDLRLPRPDVNLEVGSGSCAGQVGEVMQRFEPVCREHAPDWVVVVGDVNSTFATALVAAHLGIRVAHVEAGLRSFDRTMPEEINRTLTDVISDLLFVTEPSGLKNLRREGIPEQNVHLVGNVMIDTLLRYRERADRSSILGDLDLAEGGYALVTLHRPGNVDAPGNLLPILRALETISSDLPVVLPMHPRLRRNLASGGFGECAAALAKVRAIEPLGYLDFLKLTKESALVLTDSGGLQEETTVLGVPCLTLRHNTERPITITQGTNRLVGTETESILAAYKKVQSQPRPAPVTPELWDGKAAERITLHLLESGMGGAARSPRSEVHGLSAVQFASAGFSA